MVGFNINHTSLTKSDFAIAGATSGFITRLICQPLDVIKIRFQLQVEPISPNSVSKYRSIFQAIGVIFQEEGVKAFWKGHVPAQWLSITYGFAQFLTFEVLTQRAHELQFNKSFNPAIHFVCGSIAGGTATLVSFPFDVIRTRLVAQSTQKMIYKSVTQAGFQIIRNEGPLVLFRGLWPTVLQIGPHAGAQFMCYKLFDDLYNLLLRADETTLTGSLISGSLAGLCAKTVVYPFDLAKKRMQIQGFEEGRIAFGQTFQCTGFSDCLFKIYRIEGVLGFFKGLSPSLVKAVCASALHFSSYEMICKALRKSRD